MYLNKLDGIIINRRTVADSDRFLTIFTRGEGKLSLYARSVRSAKSHRVGSLDLFNLIRFGYVTKGERQTLTHVELLSSYRDGKKKLGDVTRLFVIGELVDALLPEADPHPEVYALLETALGSLHRFDSAEFLIRFKKKLLFLLGYGEAPGDLDSYIESILSRPLRAKI